MMFNSRGFLGKYYNYTLKLQSRTYSSHSLFSTSNRDPNRLLTSSSERQMLFVFLRFALVSVVSLSVIRVSVYRPVRLIPDSTERSTGPERDGGQTHLPEEIKHEFAYLSGSQVMDYHEIWCKSSPQDEL